jgi:Asp-tRNA(Asn)/Glu-tRNA(Gln) amidotransferase A subunit family amidase
VEPFLPEGLDEARRLWHVLFVDGISLLLRQSYKGRESDMYSIVYELLDYAAKDPPLTLESFLDTLFGRDVLRTRFLKQMDRYPILLCPVSATPAFRHQERSWTIDGKTVEYLDSFSYSQWFNLLGNPAAVVPMGLSTENLPIGVQIVGRPWEEEQVLAVAARLEQAGGWKEPPILKEQSKV